MRARTAYADLREMAKADDGLALGQAPQRPTILGIDRAKLMAKVGQVAQPPAGKKTIHFRAAAKIKLAEKRAVPTWTGWVGSAPKVRLRGAAAIAAEFRSAALQAVRATVWGSSAARLRKAKSSPRPQNSGEREASRASTPGQPPTAAVGTQPSAPARRPLALKLDTSADPVKTVNLTKNLVKPSPAVVQSSSDDLFQKRDRDPSSADLLTWLRAIHCPW